MFNTTAQSAALPLSGLPHRFFQEDNFYNEFKDFHRTSPIPATFGVIHIWTAWSSSFRIATPRPWISHCLCFDANSLLQTTKAALQKEGGF
jgi:hypothetical protein